MKNLFKKALKLTIICSLLVLSSCEKDLYEDSIQNSNRNKISLNQFKNETKIKDFNTIFKVPVSANAMLNRTAELSEFVIDTVAIQRYVSENNKTTYSFRVYSMVSIVQLDEKYNLVYTKENNIWEKSIIAFKESDGALLTENQFENFEKLYDSRIMSSSSSNVACITENYAFHCTNSGSCAETGACDMCNLCVTRTVTVEQCGGSGATPSDPNGNGPVDPGPASYMPQDPFSFTPNLFDNPVFDNQNYINIVKAHYFFNHLFYMQQVWTNETPENKAIYNQLIQYQIQNNWSEESNDFAIEMINLLQNVNYTQEQKNTITELINISCDNNLTFSTNSNVNQNNSTVMNNSTELENFLENESSEGTDFTIEQTDPNQKTASSKFWIAGFFGGVKANVKQNMTPSYSINEVNSNAFGLTAGFSWNQSSFDVSIVGNVVTVNIYGVINYNLFIDGIGTIFSSNIHLQIKINKTTGNIISAVKK